MLVLEDYILITNWGTGVDNNGWYTYPDSYVLVVNKWNETVVKKIPCGSDAEGILYRNNKLYVATGEGVAVVDLYAMDTTKVIKAPAFQGGAKHLVLDYNDKIWATYPGNGLLRINPEAETAEKEYNIPVDWMGQIAMNYSRNKLYTFETTFDANYTAQESKIYELDLTSESHKEFAKGNYFYAIGVSPFTDNVYTAEVNNFTSNSELLVFDSAGGKLNSTLVGVGTSDFCFFTEIREE
jgi:DNA-binding beta-propeller fold protein YncE